MVWTGCSHIEPHGQLRHRGRFCGSGSARTAGGSLLPLKDCMPPPISFAMVAGQLGRSSGIGGRGQMVEFGRIWSICTIDGLCCGSDRRRPPRDPEHRKDKLHNYPLTSDLREAIISFSWKSQPEKDQCEGYLLVSNPVNFFAASTWALWE